MGRLMVIHVHISTLIGDFFRDKSEIQSLEFKQQSRVNGMTARSLSLLYIAVICTTQHYFALPCLLSS